MTYDVKDCCLEYLSSERSRAEHLREDACAEVKAAREDKELLSGLLGRVEDELATLEPLVRSESPAAPARGEAGLQSRAPMEEASEDIPF